MDLRTVKVSAADLRAVLAWMDSTAGDERVPDEPRLAALAARDRLWRLLNDAREDR